MAFLRLIGKLTLGIFLGKLIIVALENPANSNPQWNHHYNIFPLIASSQNDVMAEKSNLDQSLEMVREMDESQLKVTLLNDLALSYAELGYQEKAIAILEQSLSIAESFEDVALKVTTMSNIAKNYGQIGQKNRATEILEDTVAIVSQVTDKFLKGQLLLDISFKYREIGADETAQDLFAQSQTILAEASQPLPEFPFKETPATFKLGFAGSVNSYRDTTAFLGVDVDYYKQWSEDDIWVDGTVYIGYDSSRSVNNYRPGGLILSVYRHHFDSQWNFFIDFFNSTNQDLYVSRNDDEDLGIISVVYVGAGLNLWRGDSPRDFLDFQMGVGPRYEYEYIDFEQRRNQVSPALGLLLLGRGFSIGEAKLNQNLGIYPALDNFDNYIVTSDTNLSIPLSKRWSFTNRLFIRYRNELIFEANPKWLFFFSTGLEYEF